MHPFMTYRARPSASRANDALLPSLALALAPLLAGCADAGPVVASAEELSVLEQSSAIEGRDGGSSARVFGRSVWTYGDTVLTIPDDREQTWHHNSVSWTEDEDASNGITGFLEPMEASGAPRHFIEPTPEELAFNLAHAGEDCEVEPCGARFAVWPGEPVWDAANGRAIVSFGLIYAEPGEFNFKGLGTGFAEWRGLEQAPVRLVADAEAEHPSLVFSPDEPDFSSGLQVIDGYLYAFSTSDGDRHRARLGRVPVEEISDRAAWRFWDGDGWVANWKKSQVLFDGAPIFTLSFNAFLDQWIVVYTEPFEHEILVRAAPALEGPWSKPSVLYVAPEEDPPYDAMHHPDFEQEDGRVGYLTYSRHTSGWFGTEFPVVRFEFADPSGE